MKNKDQIIELTNRIQELETKNQDLLYAMRRIGERNSELQKQSEYCKSVSNSMEWFKANSHLTVQARLFEMGLADTWE